MALRPTNRGTRRGRIGNPDRLARGADAYELYEQDGEYVLSVELPGFETEAIDVSWDDGVLHVQADGGDTGDRRSRSFRRSFRMPSEIDSDAIQAQYKRGILDVYLPLDTDPAASGRSIPIES